MAEENIVNKKLDEKEFYERLEVLKKDDQHFSFHDDANKYYKYMHNAVKENTDIRKAEIGAIKKLVDNLDLINSRSSFL